MSASAQAAPSGAQNNPYSRSYRSPFLPEVEAWLARTGVAPTRLGWEALGDYGFVEDLRYGRDPRSRTIEHVRAAMVRLEGRVDA